MANFNSNTAAGLALTPQQLPTAELGYGAKEYTYLSSITYASQAAASTLTGPTIPAGRLVKSIELMTSVSTGSTTLAVGNATTAAKYIAAAAITTPGISVEGNLAIVDPPVISTVPETIIVTTAAATLPAAGILWIIAHVLGI